MSLYGLEELSTRALDRLPREQTVVILPVSLAPLLHLGSFTFDDVGTVKIRQRTLRDVLVGYGGSLARAGFRYILLANGHGGPGHLVALEEAAARVSRKHGVTMASLSGQLAWEFFQRRYQDRVETALGRPLSEAERAAFAEDAHGGWWETTMLLLLRPDLVDDGYKELPPARYRAVERLVPNYPLKGGGQGYVGHPAMGDPAFARATAAVLLDAAMEHVNGLLDGSRGPAAVRSPFYRFPVFRTNFPRVLTLLLSAAAAVALWLLR